jgi:hypothetical protein
MLCIAAVLAPAARAKTPRRTSGRAVLTLQAFDDAGAPASTLHAGETLVLRGTLAPAVAGEAVALLVNGAGVQSATVDAVGAGAVGTFHLTLRPTAAGPLSIVALHAADAVAGGGASAPLAVVVSAVGHLGGGCQPPATLTRASTASRPSAADGPLHRGALLWPGARVHVLPHTVARLQRGRGEYRSPGGRLAVECRAVKLVAGRLRASTGHHGRARVLLRDALATVARDGRVDADGAERRIRFVHGRGRVTSSADPRHVLRTVDGDTVLLDRRGLPRLDTWPFARSPDQRRLKRGAVPAYWADGAGCATGCRPAGALTGWPLKPFHRAHPLRAGLNEWRPANMHIGIDIQALDGTPVYAIQSGPASIAGVGTVDIRVHVGSYEYWHVVPRIHAGQYVYAHRTVIGHVIRGAGHLHLSELHGDYVNPLRPGRVLVPYRDSEEPVIGVPRRSGSQVFVEAFDPQSLRETIKYRTPVLAPAAVAWRARDAHGRALTPLVFAYRGSHHYPTAAKSLVYGPSTTPPNHPGAIAGGWACFWRFTICVPKWNYRLHGVPGSAATLSLYAWDWAGNVAERTSPLRAGAIASSALALRAGPAISPVD